MDVTVKPPFLGNFPRAWGFVFPTKILGFQTSSSVLQISVFRLSITSRISSENMPVGAGLAVPSRICGYGAHFQLLSFGTISQNAVPELFPNQISLHFLRQYPPNLLCLADWILTVNYWTWAREKTLIIQRCNL